MIFSQLTASSSMMWANLLYILFVSYFTITNADEYMKREFSLVKPYFGKFQIIEILENVRAQLIFGQFIGIINSINFCVVQLGAGMSLPYWDFTGSTLVTSNYIRLTPDIQSRSGAIWNSVVCI